MLDVAVRGADRDRHPTAGPQRRHAREQHSQLLRHGVGVARPTWPGQIQVDDQVGRVRDAFDERGQRGERPRQIRDVDHERDQVQQLAAQLEVAGDAGPTVEGEGPHVLEPADSVVAAGQHLQRGFLGGARRVEALGQQPDQRLRARDQRIDPLGVVGTSRTLGQLCQQPFSLGEDLLAGLQHQRLVERTEPNRAREVADRGVAELGCDHQPVEHLRDVSARGTGRQFPGGEPAVEQRADGGQLAGRTLLRQEDAVNGLLQLRARLEPGDPVVQQDPGQPGTETRRQRLPLDVERVQIGVKMLPRAVDLLVGVLLRAGRPVARELAEVGERREHRQLAVQQLSVVRRELPAGLPVVGDELAAPLRADVVAGDQRVQRTEQRQGSGPGLCCPRAVGRREGNPGALDDRNVTAHPVQAEQGVARVDL